VKLKELNERIAQACDLKPQMVASVQAQTFRLIAASLEKGERVSVPDFGVFSVKDVEGEEGKPPKKLVRFRQRSGEEDGENAGKEGKKRAKKEAAEAPSEPVSEAAE
jgi:nucleoid DNA-binding protein